MSDYSPSLSFSFHHFSLSDKPHTLDGAKPPLNVALEKDSKRFSISEHKMLVTGVVMEDIKIFIFSSKNTVKHT